MTSLNLDPMKKNDLSISVVIPAYNASQSIVTALNSVLKQKLSPLEVIIVDDGSIDKTCEVVQSFLIRYNLTHWKIIRQSNGGPARARDTAIQLAKGNYIALLDSDDSWLPDKLLISIEYLVKEKLDIIGAHVSSVPTQKFCRLLSPKKMLFINPYLTSSVIFSRNSYFQVGGFDLSQRYSEDYKLWLLFAWLDKRCGQISPSNTIYRTDSSNSGLSSHTWRMQRGEIANYTWLKNRRILPLHWSLLAKTASWIKYFVRITFRKL